MWCFVQLPSKTNSSECQSTQLCWRSAAILPFICFFRTLNTTSTPCTEMIHLYCKYLCTLYFIELIVLCSGSNPQGKWQSQNGWVGKGPLELHGPISLAQAGPGRAGCPGPCPACFWISPARKTPQTFLKSYRNHKLELQFWHKTPQHKWKRNLILCIRHGHLQYINHHHTLKVWKKCDLECTN